MSAFILPRGITIYFILFSFAYHTFYLPVSLELLSCCYAACVPKGFKRITWSESILSLFCPTGDAKRRPGSSAASSEEQRPQDEGRAGVCAD